MSVFFLGIHKPHWLTLSGVPMFLSHNVLKRFRTLPRAKGPWSLDSGGFTELNTHGRWTVSPREYAQAVRRYHSSIGLLSWAAIQDWMCEPFVLQKTGFSIQKHQQLSIESLIELRSIAPEMPWMPVLQGWTEGDYLEHIEAYQHAGIDLTRERIVGIGSVCRRQHTMRAEMIIRSVSEQGIALHGFGFKISGLANVGAVLASSDSMAWSLHARRRPPLEGHDKPGEGRSKGHKNCANCLDYALEWRERVLQSIRNSQEGS